MNFWKEGRRTGTSDWPARSKRCKRFPTSWLPLLVCEGVFRFTVYDHQHNTDDEETKKKQNPFLL